MHNDSFQDTEHQATNYSDPWKTRNKACPMTDLNLFLERTSRIRCRKRESRQRLAVLWSWRDETGRLGRPREARESRTKYQRSVSCTEREAWTSRRGALGFSWLLISSCMQGSYSKPRKKDMQKNWRKSLKITQGREWCLFQDKVENLIICGSPGRIPKRILPKPWGY